MPRRPKKTIETDGYEAMQVGIGVQQAKADEKAGQGPLR